jgi:hypothetical protein
VSYILRGDGDVFGRSVSVEHWHRNPRRIVVAVVEKDIRFSQERSVGTKATGRLKSGVRRIPGKRFMIRGE